MSAVVLQLQCSDNVAERVEVVGDFALIHRQVAVQGAVACDAFFLAVPLLGLEAHLGGDLSADSVVVDLIVDGAGFAVDARFSELHFYCCHVLIF